jgi:hypothetical protein
MSYDMKNGFEHASFAIKSNYIMVHLISFVCDSYFSLYGALYRRDKMKITPEQLDMLDKLNIDDRRMKFICTFYDHSIGLAPPVWS